MVTIVVDCANDGKSFLIDEVVLLCAQVVAPRYSNYAEAWETGVRRIYSVSGQVAHHLRFASFVLSTYRER